MRDEQVHGRVFLIDTHAHIGSDAFSADVEHVLERAQIAGVTTVVNIADHVESARRAVALAETYPGVYATVGIHPHEAARAQEAHFDALETLAGYNRVVAWGEIGLDYHYDFSPREVQLEVFRRQVHLARRHRLPVVIHNREADADVMRVLTEERVAEIGGVLHCFWSTKDVADWALQHGLYLGVGGAITFKNATDLRAVLRATPLERLVLETDSPYLAPVPYRGQRNEPAFMLRVAEALADLKGVPLSVVAEVTGENARRLFRLD